MMSSFKKVGLGGVKVGCKVRIADSIAKVAMSSGEKISLLAVAFPTFLYDLYNDSTNSVYGF